MNIKNSILDIIHHGKPPIPSEKTAAALFAFGGKMALFALLTALSAGYAGLVRLRVMAYRRGWLKQAALPRPVISVGNITAGGTGKTPTVIEIARILGQAGRRVAILTRGYRRAGDAPHVIVTPDFSASAVGDEPLLLAKSLPQARVIVGRNRAESGRIALERFQPDVFVLDDGMQHLRLRRDCDLVLIDATQPFGGGRVLPAGLLREPVAHLARARAFLITRSDEISDCAALVETLRRLNPAAPVFFGVHAFDALRWAGRDEQIPLDDWRGKPLLAVCGLGNPASFHRLLRGCGLDARDALDFPDHHAYAARDAALIASRVARHRVAAVVTTEKDEQKLLPHLAALNAPCGVVSIRMAICPARPFAELLLRVTQPE